MDETIRELVETKGKPSEKPYPEKRDEETKEDKERIMKVHKMALDYCGKQIQEDWLDTQVMGATSMDDMIDGRLSNLDWNNGWFKCSKHFNDLCRQMEGYWTWDDGAYDTENGYGTDYVTRAKKAVERMKAKIKTLEFELQQLKDKDKKEREKEITEMKLD